MILFKEDVDITRFKPEALSGIQKCNEIFRKYGKPCVVTSGAEGKHGLHSHHYKGLAWDLRRRHVPEHEIGSVVAEIKRVLGPDYQVVLEPNHIHAEYDPAVS